MPDFDVFSLLEIRKRKSRSHGIRKKGNSKRKKRAVKRSNTSLKDLSKVLEDHGRHAMLSVLSSLPISVLRILDTEANKFYDRNHQLYDAALLTRCYPQHALRPFIDSEANHKQHFIKIPFINKGIEFIDLPSIFKDRSVTSSIPTYFQNSEPPIICYKYNKPIRNTVFNFNKRFSDLDIHANTPESWDCKDSKFIYPAAGHIMTGNLKIISDSRIRYIVSKGPKYRFPSRIDFKKWREEIASALNDFGNRCCKREYDEPNDLKEWKVIIFKIVDQRIKFYSQNTNLLPPKPKSTFRHLKQGIQEFHGKYVLVPADKAANNVVVVWRLHYINTLKHDLSGTKASEEEKSVVNGHCNHLALKFSICVKERQDRLPTMYWLPKLHKRPYKARFIANSSSCTKLRKTFSKFYRRHYESVSKFNAGLKTLLHQGLSEPEFYGDLVYKFKKIEGRADFSDQFRKIIVRYKRIGYNINIMRQSACLVFNPITVNNFPSLFNCTPVGRASDSMMAPT